MKQRPMGKGAEKATQRPVLRNRIRRMGAGVTNTCGALLRGRSRQESVGRCPVEATASGSRGRGKHDAPFCVPSHALGQDTAALRTEMRKSRVFTVTCLPQHRPGHGPLTTLALPGALFPTLFIIPLLTTDIPFYHFSLCLQPPP